MLFSFFIIIAWYLLIKNVIPKIFNPTAELIIPIEIRTKEAKAEIQTHPMIAETKISNCSM